MKADRKKITDWLNSNWKGKKLCPICQSNNWFILNNVWESREFHSGDFVVGGPVLPLVSVMCNVCGYTLLFNAIAVGAVPRPETEEEQHD